MHRTSLDLNETVVLGNEDCTLYNCTMYNCLLCINTATHADVIPGDKVAV